MSRRLGRPRRRARHGARGARPRPVRPTLVGAAAASTDPAAIEDVHLAYFRAGAQVATTASYQATVPGFAAAGLDRAAALAGDPDERRGWPDGRAMRHAAATRASTRRRCSWPARSGRTARCSPTGPSTAATTTRARRPCATSTRRGWRRCSTPAPTCSPSRRSRPSARPRSWSRLLDELGATALAVVPVPRRRPRPPPASRSPRPCAVADGVGRARGDRRQLHGAAARARRSWRRRAAATDLPLIAYPNGGDRWDAAARRWVGGADGGFDPAEVATWTDVGRRLARRLLRHRARRDRAHWRDADRRPAAPPVRR